MKLRSAKEILEENCVTVCYQNNNISVKMAENAINIAVEECIQEILNELLILKLKH